MDAMICSCSPYALVVVIGAVITVGAAILITLWKSM